MDPLRLLTRSTKFAKKPSSAATKLQTPSAGPASNPQLFDHAHASQQNVNRKRKRGSDVAAASLDFFGGGSVAQDDKKDADDQDKSDDEVKQNVPVVAPATLGADECKQLLGRHKVKITMFDQGTGSDAPAKKKKKDKTEKKDTKGESKTALYPVPVTDFGSLASTYRVSKTLVRNIRDQGYTTATEVQLGALPLLLGSRADVTGASSDTEGPALDVDLLSIAPTGSGKTLAFMIPLIHAISVSRRTQAATGPKAIVLAPTKELASQIANEGRKLAQNTGVRITYVRKGMHLGSGSTTTSADGSEKEVPPVKADVLVSTPAALKNAIGDVDKNAAVLSNISYLVLDEADVLLDPLFREQTLAVWNALHNPALRLGFWSATMGSNIEEIVKATIKERADKLSETSEEPVPIAPLVRLVVGLKDSAVPNIDHRLIYAATEQGKLMALRELLHPTRSGNDKQPIVRAPFLVFTQTIERAVALHSELLYDIPAEAGGISRIAVLHSDLSDTARDHVMTRFRKGEVWILITTDLLSRGVDFRGVNAVVNYDAPTSAAAYVHRVGRTGRAGREGGVALTYYTDDDVASIKTVANIIVASQKQRGAAGGSTNVQQWLLDALPTPSKRDKQQLKKRGVETRRSASGKDPKTGKPQARISTKSGYIRKMENNRKGAVQATKSLQQDAGAASDSGESFGGFDE